MAEQGADAGRGSTAPHHDLVHRSIRALQDRRRLVATAGAVVVVTAGVYVLVPRILGVSSALARISHANGYWVGAAVVFNAGAFFAYVLLFRGILGGKAHDELHRRISMRVSYQITMAGLAATRVFSAGGVGGIALTYWVLRRAGMQRQRTMRQMVAFLMVLYSVYLVCVVVFGVCLYVGIFPGPAPIEATLIAAALAAVAIGVIGLVALIPADLERRMAAVGKNHRRLGPAARELGRVTVTIASGVSTVIGYMRHPHEGALAFAGAVGFWAAQIAVLWASFEAFGAEISIGILVQGFFVGMAANLIPSPVGGVGSVDAGMIAAFVVFGQPAEIVFPAVLTFRLIAFWLPIPPGVVAYFQLRRRIAGWEAAATPKL